MKESEKENMFDLLILKVTGGLSEEELKQLKEFEEVFPELKNDFSFEMTAAAISMIDVNTDEQMPAHLQAKVLADAETFFGSPESKTLKDSAGEREEEFQKTFTLDKPKNSIWQSLGWLVAAAACVVLAVNLWTTNRQQTDLVQNPPQQQITPTPTPALAEQRDQFLASAGDIIKSSWTDFDPKKPRNVEGDVVWSNSAQKGYLRFKNLPVNEKSKETYQLWIFDESQKNPVSGGVFDANEAGEIIIPINAAIKVGKPTMFGITAEKPGGVMVSELGKVMAVAKVET